MLLHPRFQETVRLAASLPVDPRGAQAAPLWRADELDARKLGGEGMLRSWPDAGERRSATTHRMQMSVTPPQDAPKPCSTMVACVSQRGM